MAGGFPEIIGDVAEGMEGEGQEVEAGEDGGEVLLAVSEVVFEIVAAVLEDVEGLVLDLPAGAAAGGEFDDVVGADGQIGDPAVAVGGLAPGVDNPDLDRVERGGVFSRLTFSSMRGRSMPVRYSSMSGWEEGLHTKMKLASCSRTASQSGWRENRSSPR